MSSTTHSSWARHLNPLCKYIMPKVNLCPRPCSSTRTCCRVIHIYIILTYLLVILLEKVTHGLGNAANQESVTRDEVAAMVTVGTEEGVLEKKENRMIQNLLKLDSVAAHEIMTPSVVVAMAEEEMTLREFYGDEEYKNFSDTITLFDWGFDNFSYRQVLDTGDAITKMDVELAQGDGQVTLYPQNDVELLLPNDMDLSELERSVIVYSDRLVAPIDQGTVLGEATLYLDKNAVATVRLVNGNAVELARGEYMKERVAEFLGRPWVIAVIVILGIFAIAYIVLVTRYRRLRRKHLKERKLAEKRREEQKRVAQQDFFDGEWKDLY